jgi:hypothetical protein
LERYDCLYAAKEWARSRLSRKKGCRLQAAASQGVGADRGGLEVSAGFLAVNAFVIEAKEFGQVRKPFGIRGVVARGAASISSSR